MRDLSKGINTQMTDEKTLLGTMANSFDNTKKLLT